MGGRGSTATGGSASDFLPRNVKLYTPKSDLTAVNANLGTNLTDKDLAAIAGAPEGSQFEARVVDGKVTLLVTSQKRDGLFMQRTLSRDKDGSLVLENKEFYAGQRAGGGFGTKQLLQQVTAAQRTGIAKIKTEAARDDGLNGYYTWARLGYNAKLTASQSKAVEKAGLGKVNDIQGLMKTEGGRQWWKTNGRTTNMEFDLKSGSTSVKVLTAYARTKGIRLK